VIWNFFYDPGMKWSAKNEFRFFKNLLLINIGSEFFLKRIYTWFIDIITRSFFYCRKLAGI